MEGRDTVIRFCLTAMFLAMLSACAGEPRTDTAASGSGAGDVGSASPRILAATHPLECVPFARERSGIAIRGDAWTWWERAKGSYVRHREPRVGAVIVLNIGRKRGHLAVVTRVEGPRRIVVDHANWLNRGRIHQDTPVQDVSPDNDWSRVRVWYTPGNQMGASAYNVVGFIYPERLTAAN